jgi:hypothetical protein
MLQAQCKKALLGGACWQQLVYSWAAYGKSQHVQI